MQSLKTILLPALLFAFIGCRKERVPEVRNYSLKNTSLRTTQTSVAGRWQLHYSDGGTSRDGRQNYINTYLTFQPNDSLYYDQGNNRTRYKLRWMHLPDENGDNVWTYCTSGPGDCTGVDGIWNDTLVLFDNDVAPTKYYLTRPNNQ